MSINKQDVLFTIERQLCNGNVEHLNNLEIFDYEYSSLRPSHLRSYFTVTNAKKPCYFVKHLNEDNKKPLNTEFLALEKIHSAGILVPKPLLFDSKYGVLIIDFIVSKEGVSLLNSPDEDAYFRLLLYATSNFHKKHKEEITVQKTNTFVNYMSRRYCEFGIDPLQFSQCAPYFNFGQTHGDLNPRNTLISDGKCYLIDFEDYEPFSLQILDLLYLINTLTIFKYQNLDYKGIYDSLFYENTTFTRQCAKMIKDYCLIFKVSPKKLFPLFPACWIYQIDRLLHHNRSITPFGYTYFIERFNSEILTGKSCCCLEKLICHEFCIF